MDKNNDEITPARAIRGGWSWLPAGINGIVIAGIAVLVAAAVITGIVYLLIPAGNAIQKKNIQNNYSDTVNSQGYQVNLLAEMQQNLSNITGPGGLSTTRQSLPAGSAEDQVVRAQELAQVVKLCAEGAQVNWNAGTPGADSMLPVYHDNCEAGTAIADPPLAPQS